MSKKPIAAALLIFGTVAASGLFLLHGQTQTIIPEDVLEHANCIFFGEKRGNAPNRADAAAGGRTLSAITELVSMRLAYVPGGSRTQVLLDQLPPIDRLLFGAMQDAGVTPADSASDVEFLRRVSLDLTGRIPAPDRVVSFLNDPAADKRAKLVEELLAKPEWVDKWTMYFGGLLKNNSANTQIRRWDEGRNAFYNYIKTSLKANKPYDQMTRELIVAQGADSYKDGAMNWIVGGVVTGGPVQDIWDQQAVNVSSTFLGISHMNCLLCHNGRGHLDTLSLWGATGQRTMAWGFASFLSHTQADKSPANGVPLGNAYYWSVQDDSRYKTDYALNTTTGNRPARQPSGTTTRISPLYPFGGGTPGSGENYRASLGRLVTSDFQFARSSVNYMWEQFFGIGFVDPSDQFDPARLDADNPPTAVKLDTGQTWPLQPSNPRLLDALARDFIASKYDLKALMREIVNSRAYQLSSRYDKAAWNPAWERLYARKLVRRLWAEEIHDAVAQSSNLLPAYNINGIGVINWAMQFPETNGMPNARATDPTTSFLDDFLRGNNDDEDRRPDGSISQALRLMNNPFIMTRIRSTGTGASASLLAGNLSLPDDQLVTNLYLAVLSRYPSDNEKTAAQANLRAAANRTQQAENLIWELYNKVDFIFNY